MKGRRKVPYQHLGPLPGDGGSSGGGSGGAGDIGGFC